MNNKAFAEDLIQFCHESASAYQAVDVLKEDLLKKGFKELKGEEDWKVKEGDKVFYIKNGTSLFAMTIGKGTYNNGFKIIGSHTDSPSFRIKPNCEIRTEGYIKLNTEVYGGPILNTWLDKPLGVAGRVTLKSKNIMKPTIKNINIEEPILYIPNLAIHMNREVNKGVELNRQRHVLPILGLETEENKNKQVFLELLAKNLKVKTTDILDYELYLVEATKGEIVGLNNEFISCKRLDNLAMSHASINALTDVKSHSGINVCACYDNEECGSSTKQGAGSPVLVNLLERLVYALGGNREAYLKALESSFLVSADLAHAVHPNYTEEHDPTNRPYINKGPVIKVSANQRYTSDADSTAAFIQICEKAKVPYQLFVNRSDKAGGSTIGPISSSMMPIRSVDIGTAILGMHSIREFGGVDDHMFVYKAFKVFYAI